MDPKQYKMTQAKTATKGYITTRQRTQGTEKLMQKLMENFLKNKTPQVSQQSLSNWIKTKMQCNPKRNLSH